MSATVDYVAANRAHEVAERDRFTPYRYRQFAKYLDEGARRVLDVGCATGRGGAVLKSVRPELELIGLDCLPERLAKLPSVYSGTVCSFTTKIDLTDNSVDTILAGEFIEHVTYADGIQTLAEFHRILRPRGQVMLTTPFPDYLRLVLAGRSTVGGAHVSAHYPKQLKVMLNDAGFRDVFYRPSGGITRFLGDQLPFMWLYGSFLIMGRKG